MKNEWKWLATFGIVSVLIVGLMTDFTFREIEIQLLDTYIVLGSFNAILYLSFAFFTIMNLHRIVALLADRNLIMAILIAIINPLIGLFTTIFLYHNIDSLMHLKQNHQDLDISAELCLIFILSGILVLQTIMEIRVLKRLSTQFDNQKNGYNA